MNKVVTILSFRRGSGKSTLINNLAVLLAMQGRRVALIDTDFQAASAHLFFGTSDGEVNHTLNDYLLGRGDLLTAALDVTPKLGANLPGKLFLIPASTQMADIRQMLRTSPDIDHYTNGLEKLEQELALDLLLVDAPAGVNEETTVSMAVSQTLIVVLHPDQRDFQGTAVIVDVARNLEAPIIHLILNDAPQTLNIENILSQLEKNYRCESGLVVNHSEELLALGSSQPFVLRYPAHPLTNQIKELAKRIFTSD